MIKTTVKERGSGKTTNIIERMKQEDIFCIVGSRTTKECCYPKELHHRILCINSPLFLKQIESHRDKRFVFDEGFMLPQDQLAELYYSLGQMNINLEVVGSITTPHESEYQRHVKLHDKSFVSGMCIAIKPEEVVLNPGETIINLVNKELKNLKEKPFRWL